MDNKHLRAILIGGLIVTTIGLIGLAPSAMAQTTGQTEQEKPAAKEIKEEVQVTGTLIPRPTLEAMSPVTTMDIEEIAYRGITRLEDLLTSLPQVFNAQNSTIANGASGTATVDLRYLGAQRTLVLIDGRRMPNGDAFSVSPDLNFIPAALVKRVDVLTGGASSVYGADAVAGVVNFILDKDFEGVRVGLSGGGYQHDNRNTNAQAMNARKGFYAPKGQTWDGGIFNANLAMGGKFANGKGHASLYFDYRKTSALLKARRDYTACTPSLGATGPTCGGSSTIPNGRFIVFDRDYNQKGDYTLDLTGSGNTFRNRTGSDLYNYGPINFMQRPDERLAAGGFATYEINKNAEAYLEVMYMDDYTDAQIAPSGDFGSTNNINCDNPMLSADQYKKICTDAGFGPHDIANVRILKRNVEGGPRVAQLRHTSYRFVAGLKGELGKGWNYDLYGLQNEVHSPQSYANDLNRTRLQDVLIVDGDRSDPSTWHCRSGNAGCVPWNLFTKNGVTQAALSYLSLPLILNSGTKTTLLSAKVTGDLGFAFPTAAEDIKFALGTEYRKEFLFVNPDQAYRSFLGAGQGGPVNPVSGSFRVRELFTEVLVPIVQGARGAKDLSLELGYRYSDYNTSGKFPSYKLQASYAPFNDLKVRMGKNRATRAPNVQELFVPQGVGLGGTADICAGPNPAYTQAQCARTGVTAAKYGHILENPSGQYNTIFGGNPNLTPEIADTFTAGVVISPTAIAGFNAALDYYDIKIKKTIGNLAADDIISQCVVTGNPLLCSLIHRDVAGTLWLTPDGYTLTTNQNVGQRGARGLDVNINYIKPIGNSLFSVNLIGSRLMHATINTGLYSYDCVGYFGNQCGDPSPTWRHLARFSFETGKVVLSMGWRMVGAVINDDSSSNTAIGDASNVALLKLNKSYQYPAYHYLDLAASYNVAKGVQFTFGINNIADKEPPLGTGMNGNDYGPGFHGTYDPYGRYLHSNLNFTF